MIFCKKNCLLTGQKLAWTRITRCSFAWVSPSRKWSDSQTLGLVFILFFPFRSVMIISWGSGWLPELTAALIDFLKFTATTAPFHCNLFILSTCIERIKNSKRIKRRARTKSSYSLFQPDPSNVESLHLCQSFFSVTYPCHWFGIGSS